MRWTGVVALALLTGACRGLVALDGSLNPAVTPDDASAAGVDATNPQQLPSASSWVLPDGALCADGQTLCTACDGGAYCAAGCPLNICPIDDALVDASGTSDADAEALDADAGAPGVDAGLPDADAGMLDAGEPFTFLLECSNFLDASLGVTVDATPGRVYCALPDFAGVEPGNTLAGCYYETCPADEAGCAYCVCGVGGWTCTSVPR